MLVDLLTARDTSLLFLVEPLLHVAQVVFSGTDRFEFGVHRFVDPVGIDGRDLPINADDFGDRVVVFQHNGGTLVDDFGRVLPDRTLEWSAYQVLVPAQPLPDFVEQVADLLARDRLRRRDMTLRHGKSPLGLVGGFTLQQFDCAAAENHLWKVAFCCGDRPQRTCSIIRFLIIPVNYAKN